MKIQGAQIILVAGVLLAGCKKSSNATDNVVPPDIAANTQNFTTAEYYDAPHQTQMKLRLSGAEGQPLTDGLLLIKQFQLESFNTNGSTQAVIEAPECIYDAQHDTADSAGRLWARSGDGRIILEGDGFLWRQDESFLTISNNVRTLIASIAVAVAGATNAVAQTNWEAQLGSGHAPTLITAHTGDFILTTRRAIYSGDVHVSNPQMDLVCARLVADLAPAGGRVDHIVAETNVVINFTDDKGQTDRAICDRAVYNYSVQNGVTNEIVTLTGNAAVTNFAGTNVNFALTGEPIYLDLLNKTVHAENEKFTINPNAQTANTNSPAVRFPPGADTNFPPGKLDLAPPGHPGNTGPKPTPLEH